MPLQKRIVPTHMKLCRAIIALKHVRWTWKDAYRWHHAFEAGRYVETAYHDFITKLVEQLGHGGYAMGTYLDIEGAFNTACYAGGHLNPDRVKTYSEE